MESVYPLRGYAACLGGYCFRRFWRVELENTVAQVEVFQQDKTEDFAGQHRNGEGERQDFRIVYTSAIEPLQQYLIEFPGGRLQALQICWDTLPAAQGGQRWFHLYPEEEIPPSDELHWTRRHFNWNFMCADCHSTNLAKNYDATANGYRTGWSDMNVSCEACHGPGSRHIAWAQTGKPGEGAEFGLLSSSKRACAWRLGARSNEWTTKANRPPRIANSIGYLRALPFPSATFANATIFWAELSR